ncbi:YezD family protein [Clostridium arbusti]|uniref:YezD family protein n=1 Tax=Clostridium arbusti TaxID=1137848 RepID=UPI0002885D21|nr:YezD family protein [Clostridium arbusti]
MGDVNNVSRLYKKKETVSQANLEKILQLLGEIKYGSVTLVIQDGVLIQIETNEKIRLK